MSIDKQKLMVHIYIYIYICVCLAKAHPIHLKLHVTFIISCLVVSDREKDIFHTKSRSEDSIPSRLLS